LRRVGLTAAALILASTAGGCGRAQEPFAHSCVAIDKKFIETANLNVTASTTSRRSSGPERVAAEEIAVEAFSAAERLGHVKPNDPSLKQAQKYLDSMFNEYGEAVTLHAEGKNPGERMQRAYGLANFAHDVLAEAQPALQAEGCDVAPLL
jgi:hypothetical protein